MASKINPKGIFKSTSRSKGPNPKGINPGGINNKTASKPAPKPAAKPVVSKPVTSTTAPRTRAGVSKGTAPGVGSKYSSKSTGTKPNVSKGRAGVSKGNAPGTASKYANKTPINKVDATSKVGKVGKVAGKLKGVAGKAAGAATLFQIGSMIYDDINERSKAMFKRVKAAEEKAKKDKVKKDSGKKDTSNTGKPKVGGNETGISKKSTIPDMLNKLAGNKQGDGSSVKFTGDRSKVAGKDKWGRSPSDKWYGFNPTTKKYEAPTMVKADNKKTETKPAVKKPATTPKATTPPVKKAEPVGTLTPKTTQEIANKSLEEKKTIEPAKTTTPTTTAATTSSTSSSSTTSPSATSTQPRATIANKIRGALNASRERRAERAEARGNEGRAEKLRDKIEDTSKKMMMKKGGAVKSKSKKK